MEDPPEVLESREGVLHVGPVVANLERARGREGGREGEGGRKGEREGEREGERQKDIGGDR